MLWSLGAAAPEPGTHTKNSVQLEAVFMLLTQRLEGKGRSCHSGSITDCQEGSQEGGKWGSAAHHTAAGLEVASVSPTLTLSQAL